MPTLLEWVYEAGNEASIKERRGVQRIHFGDTVVDDFLGQGRGLSLFKPLQESRQLKIEFIESGEKVVRDVSASSVYALACREPREVRAPVKSTAARPGSIVAMLKPGAPASPTPINAPPAKRQKGLGKAKAPQAAAGGAGAAAAPAAEQAATALALIGAQYADDDDDDDDASTPAPAPARAAAGKVGIRSMSSDEKAAYKHAVYVKRKDEMHSESIKGFDDWLAKNALYGWHCVRCIGSLVKPADRLSTTGYGWTGEGEARMANPIPSRGKLQVCSVYTLTLASRTHAHLTLAPRPRPHVCVT
jgi:hypothetical protein